MLKPGAPGSGAEAESARPSTEARGPAPHTNLPPCGGGIKRTRAQTRSPLVHACGADRTEGPHQHQRPTHAGPATSGCGGEGGLAVTGTGPRGGARHACPQHPSSDSAPPMVDPGLTGHIFHTAQQRNVSSAATSFPSRTEDSSNRSSGIIPGLIAAGVFIVFVLALYAVLWRCMVSPPRRKQCKLRIRGQQKVSV